MLCEALELRAGHPPDRRPSQTPGRLPHGCRELKLQDVL